MSDMRYELRISAHEILGSSQALVEVYGHDPTLMTQSKRLVRVFVDTDDAENPTPERWARDICVAIAEHF